MVVPPCRPKAKNNFFIGKNLYIFGSMSTKHNVRYAVFRRRRKIVYPKSKDVINLSKIG